jgi:SAM-dependent methyltransferase
MDTETADFYKRYAQNLKASSEASQSAMLPYVKQALIPGASVLDVGSGSGRDVAALFDSGFSAFGVDPSKDMLENALRLHPSLAGRLERAILPGLGRPFSECMPAGFDAVVCSAVLMHLEPAELPHALESLVEQLRSRDSEDVEATSPALLISLPHRDRSRLTGHRDAENRKFHNHSAEQVCEYLVTLRLSLERAIDSDAAFAETGTLWKTLVFRRGP